MIKRGFKIMLAEAKSMIEVISVQDLSYHLDENMAILIDVRETVERDREGEIPGSLHISRGLLEFQADPESPVFCKDLDPERNIILYCGTGGRSALAAKTLIEMGYPNAASLAGGYEAWRLTQKD